MAESAKLDMALDDIIKQTKPAGGRRGRGRGATQTSSRARAMTVRGLRTRGAGRGNIQTGSFSRTRNAPEGRWAHDRFNEDTGAGGRNFGLRSSGSANDTTKLLISNLDFGVSDSDVKELFSEFGPLRRAAVHYDKTARSLGSADVVFERRTDAVRAVKQYNGVPLDGRPMKIQMVNVPSNGLTATPTNFGNNKMRGFSAGRRETTGARRSRGGGRGAARGGRTERSAMTQEQLDADLDAYINKME